MTSNIHDWENEEDEIPITADAGIFSKPNFYENDPLAGDHELEDTFEKNRPNETVEIGFGGRTRSSSKVKVATATPTKKPVLSHRIPAPSISSTNLIPSYINKKAFTAEMDKNVACIIDESIGLFGLDPRGYHPFYLRIYKYIDIGLKNKHIISSKDIRSYWEKYDRICTERLKKPMAKTTFTGIESPYATYIKTGKVVVNGMEVNLKRNEAEIKKRFMELEKLAKDIVNQWKEGQSKSILGDLTTRLQFFNQCKSMTFPADCVKMNKLWHRFLYEFPQLTNTEHVEVKMTDAANDLNVRPVHVPKIKCEETFSVVDVEMIAPDDDDCRSQMELDVDVKSQEFSQANSSNSAKRGRKHKTGIEMTEFNLPVIKIKNPVSNKKIHISPSTLKNEKALINTEGKSKIGAVKVKVRAKQEQKRRFKLSQLKVTHALKKLKLKRKGSAHSALVKKQVKLENMICSGALSKVKSSFKKKQSQKKESSPSLSSPTFANIEGQISPPPSHPRPPLVSVDHLDKNTATDHSSVMENPVSLDHAAPSALLTNRKLKKRCVICDICGKVLSRHRYLITHKLREHKIAIDEPEASRLGRKKEEEKGACDICGQVITRRSNLLRHKFLKHSSNKNRKKKQCPICLEEFWMLWPHFQQVHIQGLEGLEKGTKHSSTDNDIVEPPPENLNHNIRKPSGPVACEICGKPFPYHSVLVRHMEQIHETKGKSFLCQECPKQFKMKDSLDAHMKQIHLGENYRCDICSRVMQSGGKLWKHKVDVHGMSELEPPPGVTLMQCEYCGEKLLRGMLQHIQKNHPEQEAAEKERTKAMKREFRKRRCERRRAAWKDWRTTGKGPLWLQEYDVRRKKWRGTTESWTCPAAICGKVFEGNYNFELHLRQGHGSDDKFIAVLEKIQFLKRTPNETWQCVACEENLDYVDEVKVHFALQHQQTVKKIQGLGQTISATTSETLYCPHCGKKLDGDQALRDHAENIHPEMCCKCPECKWLVISPAELQEHFMLEHTDPDPFLEWRKHKEEENMKNSGTSTSKEAKCPVNVKSTKIKKPVTKSKRKVQHLPTAPPKKIRGRGRRAKSKPAKSEDSDSDNFGNSDDNYPKVNRGLSSLPTRRTRQNVGSPYKAKCEDPVNDCKLNHCKVFVKRLSEAEIAFYTL